MKTLPLWTGAVSITHTVLSLAGDPYLGVMFLADNHPALWGVWQLQRENCVFLLLPSPPLLCALPS